MQPENQWQGTGNQPAIIKMVMEKSRMEVGFDQPTINGIREATSQKERIAIILEAERAQSA